MKVKYFWYRSNHKTRELEPAQIHELAYFCWRNQALFKHCLELRRRLYLCKVLNTLRLSRANAIQTVNIIVFKLTV